MRRKVQGEAPWMNNYLKTSALHKKKTVINFTLHTFSWSVMEFSVVHILGIIVCIQTGISITSFCSHGLYTTCENAQLSFSLNQHRKFPTHSIYKRTLNLAVWSLIVNWHFLKAFLNNIIFLQTQFHFELTLKIALYTTIIILEHKKLGEHQCQGYGRRMQRQETYLQVKHNN